jgi:hypothetical protein
MKVTGTRLAAMFLLALTPVAGHAQDFSADVEYVAAEQPGSPSAGTETAPPSFKSTLTAITSLFFAGDNAPDTATERMMGSITPSFRATCRSQNERSVPQLFTQLIF